MDAVSRSEQQQLADALEPVTFSDGDEIITEGDFGEHVYIVEEGEVCATCEAQDGVLAQYGRGDFFGELALMTEAPRLATVVAQGKVKCVMLGRSAFQRLVGKLGGRGFRGGRRRGVSSESTTAMRAAKKTSSAMPVVAKSEEQVARVKAATRSNILFSHLRGAQRESLVGCMSERHASPGEAVIKQGDEGDYFCELSCSACFCSCVYTW